MSLARSIQYSISTYSPSRTELGSVSLAARGKMTKSRQPRYKADSSSKPKNKSPSRSVSPPPSDPSSEPDASRAVTPIPAVMAQTRLLVCSIGNPGASYANTLHSAGHTVLNVLTSSLSYPSFQKSKAYPGVVSAGTEFTLWQSPSYMNISGTPVSKAWKQFLSDCKSSGEGSKLVVIHDELELPVGQVNVRNGSASAKGHNGLKSIKEVVGPNFMRIGVGIGRPESREPNAVAAHVLRKMNAQERIKIEGCVRRVEMELKRLAG